MGNATTIRLARIVPILLIACFPLSAHAKGASFGDVISELTVPSLIQPGASFEVVVRVDVDAFCQRTTTFAGPDCVRDSTPGAAEELVLVSKDTSLDLSPRMTDITGRVARDKDGLYRGTLTTRPCQKDGPYRVASIEPNPLPAVAATEPLVASTKACEADLRAPVVTAVRLPDRLSLPTQVPADNRGWTHGKLIVDVEDDASGPVEVRYELTPLNEADTSYGGATVACLPCGRRWACTADIPLCGVADLGDLAVRVSSVIDRAGRVSNWWPLDKAPFAVVHCGGSSSQAPVLSCAEPTVVDAGSDSLTTDSFTPATSTENKTGTGCSTGRRTTHSLAALLMLFCLVVVSHRAKRRVSEAKDADRRDR